VQGATVDRLGQSLVLVPAAIVQGALLTAFVFVVRGGAPVVAIIAVAALAGAVLPPISACVRALWSEVASDAQTLEAAYALDAITQEIIYTLGPLLVGAVAVLLSPAASVLLCATITVAGAVFFATSTLSRRWQGGCTSAREAVRWQVPACAHCSARPYSGAWWSARLRLACRRWRSRRKARWLGSVHACRPSVGRDLSAALAKPLRELMRRIFWIQAPDWLAPLTRRSPGTPRAKRSRALKRSAAPSG
jgi:hypothetical protein